jgi:plastocyanin domain-containing protein
MRTPRLLVIAALALALGSFGCKDKKKKDAPKKGTTDTAKTANKDVAKAAKPAPKSGKATPDATGKVAINVSKKGYTPDSIEAKAGQELTLVFTRTEPTECGRYVKVSGKGETATELPLNKAIEIKVKVPEDGQLKFTCGMDMMTGVITVAKS